MDENRQIRFLIPPFFLYGSLLGWAYIDPYLRCWLRASVGGDLKDVVPVLAAIGAATIPLGFSIGTFGVFLLKALASISWRIWSKGTRQVYEAWLSPCCFRVILLVTKADDPWDNMRPNLIYATATFDHELLPKGIHEWLRRRFNAFIVAFNSALAIGIALVFVGVSPHFHSFPFEHSCGANELHLQQQMGWTQMKWCWLLVNLALLVLLIWAAHRSWRDTMKMIDPSSTYERRRPWEEWRQPRVIADLKA